MPLKIRQLKATLAKVGFRWRPGKGSHTFWAHPNLHASGDLASTASSKRRSGKSGR